MLSRIHIRDIAIIDSLTLDFGPGMSVLTGETGAGKSILIEALSLALGERADSGLVRSGTKRAEVIATFDLSDSPAARAWLAERGRLKDGSRCELKRTVTADGRSKASMDDAPVSLEELRTLAGMLVEIHGQHLHHSLLRKDAQRLQLDDIAGNTPELAALRERHRVWQDWVSRAERSESERAAREQTLMLLQAQLAEFNQLALMPGEPAALAAEQSRLAHADALRTATLGAYYALYEGEERSVDRDLSEVMRALESQRKIDPSLSAAIDLVASAQAQAREAAEWLRRYGERLEMDPERLSVVDRKLGQIHALARKHRVSADDLPARQTALEQELEALNSPEWDPASLATAIEEAREHYLEVALRVRERRLKAARHISHEVTAAMQELGMGGGRFEVRISERATEQAAGHGLDDVEFMVSANPGSPLKPLAKVASGGELARISLALQIVALGNQTVASLVFDEVDSGIGGAVAEIVGRKLRRLGVDRQVFCVTHLPQVAAQAHHHFRVTKDKAQDHTQTHIEQLDDGARTEEVARMLGGVDLTEHTRLHAREMIERARAADG